MLKSVSPSASANEEGWATERDIITLVHRPVPSSGPLEDCPVLMRLLSPKKLRVDEEEHIMSVSKTVLAP